MLLFLFYFLLPLFLLDSARAYPLYTAQQQYAPYSGSYSHQPYNPYPQYHHTTTTKPLLRTETPLAPALQSTPEASTSAETAAHHTTPTPESSKTVPQYKVVNQQSRTRGHDTNYPPHRPSYNSDPYYRNDPYYRPPYFSYPTTRAPSYQSRVEYRLPAAKSATQPPVTQTSSQSSSLHHLVTTSAAASPTTVPPLSPAVLSTRQAELQFRTLSNAKGSQPQPQPVAITQEAMTTVEPISTRYSTTEDHCSGNPCGLNTKCHNILDGHLCVCLPGYFTSNSTVVSCMDVDECSSVLRICGDKSFCTNTVGSYHCDCSKGFHKSQGEDDIREGGLLCQDVDECDKGQHDCGDHATCTNTEGGYVCTCLEGFSDEGSSSCEDIDECAALPGLCGAESVCSNTAGSYQCSCRKGYTAGLMGRCEEMDECRGGDHDCGPHSVCRNTAGGYDCQCQGGYQGDPPYTLCSPECQCGPNSDCAVLGGLGICSCREGYQGGPPVLPCEDVDECQSLGCGDNAVCENTVPGYTCTCKPGYEGDGYSGCHSVGERKGKVMPTMCSSPLDCQTNMTCKHRTCRCRAGFYDVSPLCLDKDECSLTPYICGENSFCINIVGGYLCSCKEGYDRYPPSYACTRVNPCRRECGEKALCKWKENELVHACSCEEGFVELLTGGCAGE